MIYYIYYFGSANFETTKYVEGRELYWIGYGIKELSENKKIKTREIKFGYFK